MTPGIPGVGLGGLFFIISALLAPGFELVRTVQGRSSPARWRLVLRQAAIALSIVFVTSAMLWLLELFLLGIFGSAPADAASAGAASDGQSGMLLVEALERLPLAAAPILITLALLIVVLGCAEALRLVLRRPRPVPESARLGRTRARQGIR